MKITDVTYAGNVVQLTFDSGDIYYMSATNGGFTASDHIPVVGDMFEPDTLPVICLISGAGVTMYYAVHKTRVLKEIK